MENGHVLHSGDEGVATNLCREPVFKFVKTKNFLEIVDSMVGTNCSSFHDYLSELLINDVLQPLPNNDTSGLRKTLF